MPGALLLRLALVALCPPTPAAVGGKEDSCQELLALPHQQEAQRRPAGCWEGLQHSPEDCCAQGPRRAACWPDERAPARCCTCSASLREIRIALRIVSHRTAQGWNVDQISERSPQPQVRRSHRDLTAPLRAWMAEALLVLQGRAEASAGFRELAAELAQRRDLLARSCPEAAALLRRLGPELLSQANGGRPSEAPLLSSWLERQDADRRGNSLCFSRRRTEAGLTFEACCGAQPPGACWDGVLRADACCRPSGHQCAQLRLVSWTPGDLAPQSDSIADEQVEQDLRCATEDLYREYFEDTRRHVVELLEHGWEHRGKALPETSDVRLIRAHLAVVEQVCPEVAALARLGIVQQQCEDFLRRPLAPAALDVQREVGDMLESGAEYIREEAAQGRFTGLAQAALDLLLEGACGKVLGAGAPDPRAGGGQADYAWPSATLAGQPLAEHGLPCAQGAPLNLGNKRQGGERTDGELPCFVPGRRLEDTSCGFVHLSNPMPADGRLVEVNLLVDALPGAFIEVTVLRLEHDASGPVYVRRSSWAGTSTATGLGITYELPVYTTELLVWRGDYLCISFRNAQMHYRTDCPDCRVAAIKPRGLSNVGVVDLVQHHSRAYVWNAKLVPMHCAPALWRRPEDPLPPRGLGAPPSSSRASCSPAGLDGDRLCIYSDVCYDFEAGDVGFFGDARAGLPLVGLSAWNDGRALWRPRRAAHSAGPVEWVAEPAYLAVRHAPQNWGHFLVETVLGIFALALATEDAPSPHGRRVVVFLDDCSPVLRGDAVEYCLRYDPQPLHCVQEIPQICGRFTAQLWPLLSDWAPLELPLVGGAAAAADVAGVPGGVGAQPLCFRSLRAGMAPWRRKFQGPVGEAALWAADPLLAPVLRLFRSQAIARLGVPAPAAAAAQTLAAAVKDGRQSVQNREELLGWLATAAATRGMAYAEVDFGRPLAAQAALLLSARLLVASAGSSQFVGIFLPAGAALLVLPACYTVVASGIASCQAEELLAACGLRWASYPVRWKDMAYTIGRGFAFAAERGTLEKTLDGLLEGG